MTNSFLSWFGELNFHFLFSSRFSRIGNQIFFLFLNFKIFEEKNSLSLLNLQDFEGKILFLISMFECLPIISHL